MAKICRVCLLIDENNKDIFHILQLTNYTVIDLDIKERLELYGGIKINRINGLSNYICHNCYEKVMNDNTGLRQKCHYAEKVIQESRIKFGNFLNSHNPGNQLENYNQSDANMMIEPEKYLTSEWKPFPHHTELVQDPNEGLIAFGNHNLNPYANYIWDNHNIYSNTPVTPNNNLPNIEWTNSEYVCKIHEVNVVICEICKGNFMNIQNMIIHLDEHKKRNLFDVYNILKKIRVQDESEYLISNVGTEYERAIKSVENNGQITKRSEGRKILKLVNTWVEQILDCYKVFDINCSVCHLLKN